MTSCLSFSLSQLMTFSHTPQGRDTTAHKPPHLPLTRAAQLPSFPGGVLLPASPVPSRLLRCIQPHHLEGSAPSLKPSFSGSVSQCLSTGSFSSAYSCALASSSKSKHTGVCGSHAPSSGLRTHCCLSQPAALEDVATLDPHGSRRFFSPE